MMESKNNSQNQSETSAIKKTRRFKKIRWAFLILLIFVVVFAVGMYGNNNISSMNDEEFARELDIALVNAISWFKIARDDIIKVGNVALIKMIQDANSIHAEPEFSSLVDDFLAKPSRPDCWKAMLDPKRSVSDYEINQTIAEEIIDARWALYAIAPDKAKLSEKQLAEFYDGDLWQGRQLTHQLFALSLLRERRPSDERIEPLIEHICDRLANELKYDMAVVDIYIQKNAFILKGGYPGKINRRWIERIIENQQDDGGWNDRWLCFRSYTDTRRPVFTSYPPSNHHATVQALWLLYQVKYRYPEHFGLNRLTELRP